MDKQNNVNQEGNADQEQPEAQGQTPDQEQPEAQEQTPDQEQEGDKETDLSEEKNYTLIQIFDLLKKSNLINMDISIKSLLEQVQSVQPDLPAEWGIIGDSGHWVLIWRKDG